MFSKIVLFVFFFISSAVADEMLSSYINITSNTKDTTIFLDNKKIGNTPISLYELTPNKTYLVKAVADKKYYKKDLYKLVTVLNNNIPTINFEFEKAKAKVFFVGVAAELYINGNYITKLQDDNRVHELDADKNATIKLIDKEKRVTLYKKLEANQSYKIKYQLINIPKDIRIYTTTINKLMWEDTQHAKNTPLTWEEGRDYCKLLRIGEFENWRLPTIEELDFLYTKHNDKIYNGFSESFYWSQTTTQSDSKIWQYSEVKEFTTGKKRKPVVEIDTGVVRCVRDITPDEYKNYTITQNTQKKDQNETNKTIERYDENLTKNLERFMLK